PTTAGPPDWAALARSLTGKLVLPAGASYATDKQEYNPRFDGTNPAAIAYCQTAADVQRCVAFAHRHGVEPVARSGGHSFAGYSTGSGLVIDVGPMGTVRIDARAGVARVGAGARLIDIYSAMANAGVGLAGGSCPTVGIAGLALGGGMGVVDRRYGLTCDALRSLDVVTADSRLLTCGPGAEPDLYWASRGGGGGSFGVATSFTFGVHPAGPLALFTLEWPFAQAAGVLGAWQAWGPGTPDELWSNCQLLATGGAGGSGGSGGTPRLRVTGVYVGTAGSLAGVLAPLVRAAGGSPSYRFVGPEAYLRAMLIEAGCEGDSVAQCHLPTHNSAGVLTRSPFAAKSDFLTEAAPAPGVAAVVGAVEERQASPELGSGGIVFDLTGGAINRVAPGATAFVHRDTAFLVEYSAGWATGSPAGVAAANQAWLERAWSAMRPYASGQAYQNYVDPGLADWKQAYYGANLPRLMRVKGAYDPDDVFRSPQGIPLP
ncbi:MAG: FAD-binding oxidoreductase, partial [Acidimicrobiales bacterium]